MASTFPQARPDLNIMRVPVRARHDLIIESACLWLKDANSIQRREEEEGAPHREALPLVAGAGHVDDGRGGEDGDRVPEPRAVPTPQHDVHQRYLLHLRGLAGIGCNADAEHYLVELRAYPEIYTI